MRGRFAFAGVLLLYIAWSARLAFTQEPQAFGDTYRYLD